MKNLANTRFGRLTAISVSYMKHNRNYWLCQCDCGASRTVNVSYLLNNKVQSCGCIYKETGAYNTVIYRYQRQATERRLLWELSDTDAIALFQKPCHYCNTLPANVDSRTKVKYNGIDRIDSALGYTLLNCVSCCVWCNRAKGKRSYADFILWIDKLHNNIHALDPIDH